MPVPLTTARLTLLPWSLATDAHKDGLVTAWDDPEVWRYVGAGRDGFTRA
ncbi:MAG: Protein N-acetyltransferase, RimJ/RimL family, partial [Modestobacter sp.]|nr:Protein N-acetyltransferase, RimJ/RimL family [Modestobacter sp.]